MPRPRSTRDRFAWFQTMTTRWRDNDVYGHLNNAVYYEYVDACVNNWLIERSPLVIPGGPVVGLVVETGCVFHASLTYPGRVETGLRVGRVGTTSVLYEIGLFAEGADAAAAEARFTHVYVDAESHRPRPLDAAFRAALERLAVP